MMFRAPVHMIKSGKIARRNAHIVVVMRHFPRFTARDLIDEYVPTLAPDPALFREFKAEARLLKHHNKAFVAVAYETRFGLSEAGLEDLKRLAALARSKTVYLVCQCGYEDFCHADLLLITAKTRFDAQISQLPHPYHVFHEKLANGNKTPTTQQSPE